MLGAGSLARRVRGHMRAVKIVRHIFGLIIAILGWACCSSAALAAEPRKDTESAKSTPSSELQVRILEPAEGATIRSPQFSVRVAVRRPKSAAAGLPQVTLQMAREGVEQNRGLAITSDTPASIAEDGQELIYQITAQSPHQDFTLIAKAKTPLLSSDSASIHLHWDGNKQNKQDIPFAKPKLYVLSVGISNYKDQSLQLTYPSKDAADVTVAFKRQHGQLYRDVETKLLVDSEATKANILDGLEWLQQQTTARDVAILFLAGHGINEASTGRYHYLPYDAEPRSIKRTMLSQEDIQSTLRSISGKVLLFLDTCHSGNVLNQTTNRGAPDASTFITELMTSENGIVVFAASTGRQASKESTKWDNGAFTRALLEALHGAAAFVKGRPITVTMLDLYLSERVKILTEGSQSPTTSKPSTLPDFPVIMPGESVDSGSDINFSILSTKSSTPVYKSWWFWTSVGVAAAGVALGLGLGLAARGPDLTGTTDIRPFGG